jgi:hypothetical protein
MSKVIEKSEKYDSEEWSDDGSDDGESENESEKSKEKEESESEDDIDKNLFFCPCNSVILKKKHLLLKHYYTSKHQRYILENPDEN